MSCTFQMERDGGHTIVRLSGTFDPASAGELTRVLEGTAEDLVLDFSLVREFADLGVATLAHGLTQAARPLRLRGLRQHQLRMFRYFGLDVEDVPSPGDGEPLGSSAAS